MNDNDLLSMKTNFGMGFTIQSILDENSDLLKVNPLLTDSTKQKSEDVWSSLDAQAAFLGPNLWGSSPESDLKLEYVDLEQFLDENDLLGAGSLSPQPPVTPPPADGLMTPLTASPPPPLPSPPPPPSPPSQEVTELASPVSPSAPRDIPKPVASRRAAQDKPKAVRRERSARSPRLPVKFEISPADLALASVPGAEFDPQTHHFSEDDLKPQPMCKKSKKQVVPEESKDQKYWTRRERNNYAAKRSRDARRLKENQIILRANFLEKENSALKETLEQMTRENERLRARASTCTCRQ